MTAASSPILLMVATWVGSHSLRFARNYNWKKFQFTTVSINSFNVLYLEHFFSGDLLLSLLFCYYLCISKLLSSLSLNPFSHVVIYSININIQQWISAQCLNVITYIYIYIYVWTIHLCVHRIRTYMKTTNNVAILYHGI